MLTSVRLADWKSFGGTAPRLPVAPLTLLLGPNASGKSNFLDALRFLQGAALDLPYVDVLRGRWEGQREVWPAIRGNVVEAARWGQTSFRLTSAWKLEGRDLEHAVAVTTTPEVVADHERLSEGSYLFDTHGAPLRDDTGRRPGGAIRVAFKATGKGNSSTGTKSASRSLLGQLEGVSRLHPDVVSAAGCLRRALRAATFLDIQPARMRDYRPENGGALGSSGENISPVLAALAETPGRLEDVVDWLGEIAVGELQTIDFDHTQLREVMMMLVEPDGRRISARSLSDGTLRFLGHVVAMLTSDPKALLIVEEPDIGLHPSRVRVLAEILESVTARRGVQIVATTHSPALLAHLSEKALGDALVFGREAGTGITIARRLRDLPGYETLRSSDHLAQLASTGWLERAL